MYSWLRPLPENEDTQRYNLRHRRNPILYSRRKGQGAPIVDDAQFNHSHQSLAHKSLNWEDRGYGQYDIKKKADREYARQQIKEGLEEYYNDETTGHL